MRTGFSTAFLAAALLAAPGLRAEDGGAAPATAPQMQDYQNRDRDTPSGSAPAAPSGVAIDLSQPSGSSASPSSAKPDADKDKDWLLKGVEAQRKAEEARDHPDQPKDNPLKPVDPLAPSKPYTTPTLQTNGFAAKPPPIKPIGGITPNVPAAPKQGDGNQYKPLIQGLSTDATKPLAGSTTNSATALSNFRAVEPINPDVTRPLFLDSSNRPDNSYSAYGTAPVSGSADVPKLPPGYEIPNAPGSRPMGAAPIAGAAPMAPVAPQARPAGSSALSAFAPVSSISVPTAPAVPSAPTARDLAPKVGSGAMKVKDPVSADLPFIR